MSNNVQPPTPEQGLPEYDFETATEAERWAYDQGWEDALDPARLDIAGVREVMEVVLAALTRLANEQAERTAKNEENRS